MENKRLVNELVRRLVLAWDPDFTKLTPSEKSRVELAEKELSDGEYVTLDELTREIS